jgi:DMSO/TMAO reductase YedYZ molybdopterin-dependent catalytic subunit
MNERRPSIEHAADHAAERPAEPQWVHGHAHEPNSETPAGDGSFMVHAAGKQIAVTLPDLAALPYVEASGCLIISTGHGTSGPFTFGGVRLRDLLAWVLSQAANGGNGSEGDGSIGSAPGEGSRLWQHVDVVSADGFGTRVYPHDLDEAPDNDSGRPVLLAYRMDGAPLSRRQGLVRLVVPSEVDDALRQVKWVAAVRVF